MEKANIFLADGFEEIEALMVVDLLRRAKIEINMVSITKLLYVTGSHGIEIKADCLFENMEKDIDMIILPGGMPGTKNLGEQEQLVKLLIQHNKENKMIGAICAAPSILGKNGILKGKKATCYPGFEEQLLGASYLEEKVVCDGNIITSRGLGTSLSFALAIIKHFKGDKLAEEIQRSVQDI